MGIPTNVSDLSTFGPGQKVALGPWIDDNLVTNQSGLALNVSNVGTDSIAMPYAGSIIAISVALNTVMSGGTATFHVTKNGTTVLSSGELSSSTGRSKYATQKYGVDTFVAGDRIGVKATTSASYAPTTNDPVVVVVVEL